ncbi:MAG: GNAT family N-acetyltransferase [Planctomycetes bacterium]|nr:GNAT family N-acetyltransferase [Planctomycetota bacterium]
MRRVSLAELDHAESAWNRAAARTATADPFCCRTEWALSFHEAFAPERPLHLWADAGCLLAFASTVDPHIGPLLEPVESHWLFGDPLLGDDAVERLADGLAAAGLGGPRPAVLLSGVVPESARFAAIVLAFQRRYELLRLAPEHLCSASLDGGLDGYLSRRSGSWRRNLRQAARRAKDRGVGFERHRPRTAAAAAAVYDRMLAVERRSWKGLGRCGMAEPPSRDFYRVMLRRLAAAGSGRVVFARQAETDIGFVFGGLAGAVYRGQQFSYVEEWADASIGNLLQLEQIRWLGEEGAERYDMGPRMDYKRHWTETERRIDALLLRPR